MTRIPHGDLERMLKAFDSLVDATEAYQAFVSEGAEALRRRGLEERAIGRWTSQQGRIDRFTTFLDDEVLERLRELVDRSAVMETAQRGDFV